MNTPATAVPEPEKGMEFSILCVEDEPISRIFLGRIISMRYPGCEIHAAENGQTGLALFRDLRPEVVLTDISMPVMDGIRMAREIRLQDPGARIIAMSAHSSLESQTTDFDTLFNRYLLKPINGKELFAAIDDCLARNTPAESQPDRS
jgi:YesN/AraC family two-component response regulator